MEENYYVDVNMQRNGKTKAQIHAASPKNAIILAAGYGMRMVPINTEVSKGLLEIHGEPLIERLIRQLHEAEIYDIYIVVGFMKERYEYLNRLIAFLEHLNPDIAVERLFSRIPEKDAVFCNWNTSWWKLRDELLLRMEEQNSFQGKKLNYLDGAALRLLDNKE